MCSTIPHFALHGKGAKNIRIDESILFMPYNKYFIFVRPTTSSHSLSNLCLLKIVRHEKHSTPLSSWSCIIPKHEEEMYNSYNNSYVHITSWQLLIYAYRFDSFQHISCKKMTFFYHADQIVITYIGHMKYQINGLHHLRFYENDINI